MTRRLFTFSTTDIANLFFDQSIRPSQDPLYNSHTSTRNIHRGDIHAPQRPHGPIPSTLRHSRPVGKDREILNNEPTNPHRLLARRVEELRQLAQPDGRDGGREVLDPEIVQAEAVEDLERADAEEGAADAFGAEVGERDVAEVVSHVGGVGVRLVRLGVQLVHADEGRVAAVGGVAGVDDVDVGDEDVFERAGRPAELHRWCRRAFPDGDALDGDVGVVCFDRVVVGVVEHVLDR